MKRVLLVSLLFALVLSVTTDLKVDWREFISRSDPLWKFDAKDENTMPVKWFDAPFHGNGNLGMLVLVEKVMRNDSPKYIFRFDVGRADVWDVRMKGSKYAHGDSYFLYYDGLFIDKLIVVVWKLVILS